MKQNFKVNGAKHFGQEDIMLQHSPFCRAEWSCYQALRGRLMSSCKEKYKGMVTSMKKKVTYEEVLAHHKCTSYEEEVAYIRQLMNEGRLIPVKSAGANGKKPAMPLKFWLLQEEEDYAALIEELQFRLPPSIDNSYYLKNPAVYQQEREYVWMLGNYLTKEREKLAVCISKNERSYDIWGQEKFLSGGMGNTILKHCGVGEDALHYYETSEPLAYYSDTKEIPQNMLIIENLDTFYSVRKKLIQGEKQILTKPMGTVIYGGGKRIARAFEDFAVCGEPYMQSEDNRIYYFGDLDYEGIEIYVSFAKRFKGRVRIVPFCEGYLAMLEKAGEISKLQKTKEGQLKHKDKNELFFDHFDKETVAKMKMILENGRYIPQEILSYTDF